MNPNPHEPSAELPLSPEQQLQELRQQLEVLYQNLRTMRHAINNDVAVILAMAELSQRNPTQSARLVQVCLEKAPQISAAVARFSEVFNASLNLQPKPPPPPA